MLIKQFGNAENEACYTRFKSVVETLKITGGEHILIIPMILWTELDKATFLQLREGKEKVMAICFILRSDQERHNFVLQDLKRSENLGRDKNPKTLTKAFDLLVRESGEHDIALKVSNRCRQRGWRDGK